MQLRWHSIAAPSWLQRLQRCSSAAPAVLRCRPITASMSPVVLHRSPTTLRCSSITASTTLAVLHCSPGPDPSVEALAIERRRDMRATLCSPWGATLRCSISSRRARVASWSPPRAMLCCSIFHPQDLRFAVSLVLHCSSAAMARSTGTQPLALQCRWTR